MIDTNGMRPGAGMTQAGRALIVASAGLGAYSPRMHQSATVHFHPAFKVARSWRAEAQ
jgi:hypothetical protein